MDQAEQARRLAEHFKERMGADFDPGGRPGHSIPTDLRVANALEYMAFQFGQINRKMTDLLEMQYKSVEALRGLEDGLGTFLKQTKP